MKISVIIPAYNAERDLPITLEHLFKSEYDDFEVIVVDDASCDQTAEAALRFPVVLKQLDVNGGAGHARNIGSRIATGEILFFIDADVWVKSDTLALINKTFETHDEIAAVVGAYSPEQPVANFFSHFQNFYTFYNHDKCSEVDQGYISWFWTACGAITKNVFEEMDGFREIYTGASAEDMDLGYRMSDKGYKILLNKEIEVTHSHHHSFRSILRNNIKKAAAWGELYLRKNWSGKYTHGFTSIRNYLTMILVAFFTISFVGSFVCPWSRGLLVVVLIGILVVNREFYGVLYSHRGAIFLLQAVLFHIIATFCAGLGGILAIVRRLIGQEGEKVSSS